MCAYSITSSSAMASLTRWRATAFYKLAAAGSTRASEAGEIGSAALYRRFSLVPMRRKCLHLSVYTRLKATTGNGPVIFGYANLYPPDHVERALPDAAAAHRWFAERGSDIPERLNRIAECIGADPRSRDAAVLGTAHLALRHGSFGPDFHAYHNENHVLELAERRLERLLDHLKPLPPAADAAALLMFAACHDLRQRESAEAQGPIGGNEAVSIAETFRILDACGFDRRRDRGWYVALELMIAGSTFDSRSLSSDAAASDLEPWAGGALARNLALWLDQRAPHWRDDLDAVRGERLAQWAADLDTANVGEAYAQLCETALRLCREHEMRAGRALDSAASAAPCLNFLGPSQDYYFFELHRFCSRAGERAFGPQKSANGLRVRATTVAMIERFASCPPAHGQAVLDAFAELTGAHWTPCAQVLPS
jgi:hypothetical protein